MSTSNIARRVVTSKIYTGRKCICFDLGDFNYLVPGLVVICTHTFPGTYDMFYKMCKNKNLKI